jgi:cell division septation protein DedD
MADDEIDKEDRDNKLKYLKKVLFVLLLVVIGLTLFWVSFKGGQKIFETIIKDSLQKNITNNKEMPNVAVDPKANGPVEGEVKSGVKESVPVKIVEPASDQIEKVNNPVIEKDIVQPTKIDVSPITKEKTEVKPSVKRQLPQSAKEEVPPSSTPIPTVTATETQSTLILAEVVNIRSEPNIKSKIISKLKKGDRVLILSSSGDWLNVKLSSGLTGWIFKALTKMVQSSKMDASPVPKAERPAEASKLEITVPDVKPAVIASTIKPEIKVPKPVVKKAVALKATRKYKEYKVIVGSFSIKANADSLVSQLKVNNCESMVVQAKTPKGQLYRVIAGSYSSLRETEAKIDELKELGFQSFYIVE